MEADMTAQTQWHDNKELWQVSEPILFAEERIEAATGEVDKIVALLQLQQASAVLDMCCGIGRHTLELARRGHSVTGVDKTAAYLAKARQRAKTESLSIELVQQEMKAFCRLDTFDAALSLFTSFGYYDDPLDNQRVLLNICASLKAGGKLIVDLHGKESLARIFKKQTWRRCGEYIVMEEHTPVDDWARLHNHWILLKGSERHDFEFKLHLYSAAELKSMLLAAGFAEVVAYGSLTGKPYDHEANRLIVVATKGPGCWDGPTI
jgi:SAM-dependent methyltransferase